MNRLLASIIFHMNEEEMACDSTVLNMHSILPSIVWKTSTWYTE